MKHLNLSKIFTESYVEYRDSILEIFNSWNVDEEATAHSNVLNLLYGMFEEDMDACGIDRLCLMITCAIYEINHDALAPGWACGTLIAIADFETGECDSKFTAEDLVEIRKDVETIKTYIGKHPELLKDWDDFDH